MYVKDGNGYTEKYLKKYAIVDPSRKKSNIVLQEFGKTSRILDLSNSKHSVLLDVSQAADCSVYKVPSRLGLEIVPTGKTYNLLPG